MTSSLSTECPIVVVSSRAHAEYTKLEAWLAETLPGRRFVRVTALARFRDTLRSDARYAGIVYDFRDLIRASPEERLFANEALVAFPTLRLRVPAEGTEIDPRDLRERHATEIESFRAELLRFEPRGIRLARRLVRHVSAMLWLPEASRPLLASSVDLSWTGAFLTFNEVEKLAKGPLRIAFPLAGQSPERSPTVEARVVWALAWNVSQRHLPGIGVHFESALPPDLRDAWNTFLL